MLPSRYYQADLTEIVQYNGSGLHTVDLFLDVLQLDKIPPRLFPPKIAYTVQPLSDLAFEASRNSQRPRGLPSLAPYRCRTKSIGFRENHRPTCLYNTQSSQCPSPLHVFDPVDQEYYELQGAFPSDSVCSHAIRDASNSTQPHGNQLMNRPELPLPRFAALPYQ